MSKRKFGGKLRREVIDALKDQVVTSFFHQKQPNTFVKVAWWGSSVSFEGVGYSKANWPDQWNATYGKDLAFEKACADIADQISRRDDAFVFVEALGISFEGQLQSYRQVAESLA